MRREVCDKLRGNVNTWQYQLQARWGDPRVYAAEQQEMARRDTRVAHDLSRRTTALLDEAYAHQAVRQRDTHAKRMAVKRQKSSTPLESAAAPATRKPPRPRVPAHAA